MLSFKTLSLLWTKRRLISFIISRLLSTFVLWAFNNSEKERVTFEWTISSWEPLLIVCKPLFFEIYGALYKSVKSTFDMSNRRWEIRRVWVRGVGVGLGGSCKVCRNETALIQCKFLRIGEILLESENLLYMFMTSLIFNLPVIPK